MIEFPISGIETFWWLPVVVAFLISALTSTGGVSGAFLILPFQISYLGFVGPSVSPTNLLYNIVAIPGGVYRYCKEGRMVWPLAWIIVLGTIPGLVIGAYLRIVWLLEPSRFKLFVGLVLLYLAVRLLANIFKKSDGNRDSREFTVSNVKISFNAIELGFNNISYKISNFKLISFTLIVGIIGGAYGIGGGAIVAPFLVTVFGLPVYVVAGAALFGTFIASIAGVGIYYFLVPLLIDGQPSVPPDIMLGVLFGVGGLAGTYVGARAQRFLPSRAIRIILLVSLACLSIKYIGGYLF